MFKSLWRKSKEDLENSELEALVANAREHLECFNKTLRQIEKFENVSISIRGRSKLGNKQSIHYYNDMELEVGEHYNRYI